MPRPVYLLVFLAVVTLIIGGTHYYIWARLVRDVTFPYPWRLVGSLAIVGLGLGIPCIMVGSRLLRFNISKPLLWVVYTWMGVFFLLLCTLVAVDVVRFGLYLYQTIAGSPADADVERRLFLARSVGAGSALVAGAASVFALRSALGGPQLVRVSVPLRRLSASLAGFTIAQISDLHVGPLLGRDYVERLVEKTNALQPRLIVLTGDLVDGSVEQLRDGIAPLAGLRAEHGVYFVTGNHEYYSGVDEWLAELRRLGIRPLRNERVIIGQGAEGFDLAGIDDWTAAGFGNGHGANLPAALAGRDASRALVLLAHQPKAIVEAAANDVGLMLSGHTHGGQIWPFNYLVRLQQPYVSGLAQHEQTQIYVNRGTGYWGPPMRLGAPPELTLLELKPA